LRCITVILSVFSASCAGTSGTIPIDYQLFDYPTESRIELVYHNDTDRFVCLLPGSWPNTAGKINFASDYMALVIDGMRFPVVGFNTGYCAEPNGCATHVAPGEIVSASIPYSDFDVPPELSKLPKHLDFSTVGVSCR